MEISKEMSHEQDIVLSHKNHSEAHNWFSEEVAICMLGNMANESKATLYMSGKYSETALNIKKSLFVT